MSKASERDLIEKLREGDDKAFKKLYHLFYDSCNQWVRKHFSVDTDLFKDVYQDSMIILYETARDSKLSNLSCSIKTYLFAICRNQMLNKFKLQKRHDEKVDEVITYQREWLEPKDEDLEKIELVKNTITKTDEPCKSILTLFYYDGLNIDEIASILGYTSKNVVKVQKSRCLSYLKQKIWKIQS